MRIVAALGGNALLRRNEPPAAGTQRENVRRAVESLVPLLRRHDVVITHGNGPQIGLLALESEAYREVKPYPLDVLGAESQGMVGYLLLEGLGAALPDLRFAALLTQVEVDPRDPAFSDPTKPIGPMYTEREASEVARQRGWSVAPDGLGWRRVVASPRPLRIVDLDAIRALNEAGVTVVCAGGGGIPVARADGHLVGAEAVIDKDLTSALLASELEADLLLLLTDVPGVATGWGQPHQRFIRRAGAPALSDLDLAHGSMAPKVEAASQFVATGGRAVIAGLDDAAEAADGSAGTEVLPDDEPIVHHDDGRTHAA